VFGAGQAVPRGALSLPAPDSQAAAEQENALRSLVPRAPDPPSGSRPYGPFVMNTRQETLLPAFRTDFPSSGRMGPVPRRAGPATRRQRDRGRSADGSGSEDMPNDTRTASTT